MYGHGVKPWELAEYTWKDVVLTIQGISQSNTALREAAYLIHCSLIEKKHRIKKEEWMPLPLDEDPQEIALEERVMKRREYMILKQKLIEKEINGSRST